MNRHLHRLPVVLGLVIAAALVVPAGAGASPYFNSDAAQATPSGQYQDLRSPDARDAADGVLAARAGVSPTTVSVTRVDSRGGFDWGDAGIGAGGTVAILLIGLGGFLIVAQRRGKRVKPSGPSILAG